MAGRAAVPSFSGQAVAFGQPARMESTPFGGPNPDQSPPWREWRRRFGRRTPRIPSATAWRPMRRLSGEAHERERAVLSQRSRHLRYCRPTCRFRMMSFENFDPEGSERRSADAARRRRNAPGRDRQMVRTSNPTVALTAGFDASLPPLAERRYSGSSPGPRPSSSMDIPISPGGIRSPSRISWRALESETGGGTGVHRCHMENTVRRPCMPTVPIKAANHPC